MASYTLSEAKSETVLTTFRYEVDVFVDKNGTEELSTIGHYLTSIREDQSCVKLTTLITGRSQDLLDVLNLDSRVTRVVVKRRDEKDAVVITSTYDIGELVRWETFVSCEEKGKTRVSLRGRISHDNVGKLEDLVKALGDKGVIDERIKTALETLAKDNSLDIAINGALTDNDKDDGNKCATVDLYFATASYKHKIGE